MNSGPKNGEEAATPVLPTSERLLRTAKQLFATRGYDGTSTAAIAKAAGTSESQLVKHYGTKERLLEAIFDEAWRKMSYAFAALDVVDHPREKLRMMLDLMLNAFESDPAIKELMLLEGRRPKKEGSDVVMTQGYVQFVNTVDRILEQVKNKGSLREGFSVEGVRSALIGMLEGMLRDQILARRMGFPAPFDKDEIRRMFTATLECLFEDGKAAEM